MPVSNFAANISCDFIIQKQKLCDLINTGKTVNGLLIFFLLFFSVINSLPFLNKYCALHTHNIASIQIATDATATMNFMYKFQIISKIVPLSIHHKITRITITITRDYIWRSRFLGRSQIENCTYNFFSSPSPTFLFLFKFCISNTFFTISHTIGVYIIYVCCSFV